MVLIWDWVSKSYPINTNMIGFWSFSKNPCTLDKSGLSIGRIRETFMKFSHFLSFRSEDGWCKPVAYCQWECPLCQDGDDSQYRRDKGQMWNKVVYIVCRMVIQVNLDMTDSMGPGKLVRHMQNPSYTYDEYLICIGLGPSISSVICKNPPYSGPSYPISPVYINIYIQRYTHSPHRPSHTHTFSNFEFAVVLGIFELIIIIHSSASIFQFLHFKPHKY